VGDVAVSWKVLVEAGVPDDAVRLTAVRFDRQDVSRAVCDWAAGPEAIEPRQVEPLLAWLRGWRRHWPTSFASGLGANGERLIAGLEARAPDATRYLKLRRIAIENLSRVL
jgi:hypothetical protein